MTPKEHNRMVGILLMAHGGFQTLIMLLLCVLYGGIGAAIFFGNRRGPDQSAGLIFIVMVAFLFVFSMIFIIPQILGGWKLYKEKPNARIWGIVASIVSCMSFPLGTAAGVYGLWFLFGELGTKFYENGSPQTNYFPNANYTESAQDFVNQERDYVKTPPPPHNWS